MAVKAKRKQSTQAWRIISEHAEVYVCICQRSVGTGKAVGVKMLGFCIPERAAWRGCLDFCVSPSLVLVFFSRSPLLLEHDGVGLPLDFGTNNQSRTTRSLATSCSRSRSRREQFSEARDLRCVWSYCLCAASFFSLFPRGRCTGWPWTWAELAVVAFGARARFWSRDAGSHETPTGSRFWCNLFDSQVGAVCPSRDVLATNNPASKLFFASRNLLN